MCKRTTLITPVPGTFWQCWYSLSQPTVPTSIHQRNSIQIYHIYVCSADITFPEQTTCERRSLHLPDDHWQLIAFLALDLGSEQQTEMLGQFSVRTVAHFEHVGLNEHEQNGLG